MTTTTLQFLLAICATALDVLVVGHCAPLLWQTWGPVSWARLGLLLLAGAMAFTLMDIWSQTIEKTACLLSLRGSFRASALLSSPTEMESSDV